MFETDYPLGRAKQQKNSITTGIKADRLVPKTMAKGGDQAEPDKQGALRFGSFGESSRSCVEKRGRFARRELIVQRGARSVITAHTVDTAAGRRRC